MKRHENAVAVLTLWADTIKTWGIEERRTSFHDPRLPWSRGVPADPVLAEVIREERSRARYKANLVNTYMHTLDAHVQEALTIRYLGSPMQQLHDRTVNGDTMRWTWDGPCTLGVVARRMKRPVRTVRDLIEKGERLVVANVRCHKLMRRGLVGEVRRAIG